MTSARWRMGLALGAALAAVLWPDVGQARTMEIVPYPIVDVWPASVRFLRVDRGFPIREKDESAGYVLFDFTDGPKACKASLELIRATDPEGRDATRLAVSIPDLPKRYEQMLIDKLTGKLREDHGPPAPPPRHNKSVEPSHPDAAVPPVPPQILLSPTP